MHPQHGDDLYRKIVFKDTAAKNRDEVLLTNMSSKGDLENTTIPKPKTLNPKQVLEIFKTFRLYPWAGDYEEQRSDHLKAGASGAISSVCSPQKKQRVKNKKVT